MPDPACVYCGKSAPRASLEVREGDKLFHLDCYRLYKRRAPSR